MCQPGQTSCVTNSPFTKRPYGFRQWFLAHHSPRGLFGGTVSFISWVPGFLGPFFQLGPPVGVLCGNGEGGGPGPHLNPGEAGRCVLEVCLGLAMVEYTYSLSVWESEAGGSLV